MRVKGFFLFILLILQSACQSLNVVVPGPVIDSPVVNGVGGNADLELGFKHANGVRVLTNAGSRPFVSDPPKMFDTAETYGKGLIGIGRLFEATLSVSLPTPAFLVSGKFQFLGAPRSEMKKGQYSAAIYGVAGSSSSSTSGDQATAFGPGGFPWRASGTGNTLGYGVSGGYHVSDRWLFYFGAVHYSYEVKYTVNQSESKDGTSAAASYSGVQEGATDSAGIGVEGGNSALIGGSVQYYSKYWVQNPTQQGFTGAVYMKILFD